MGQNNAAIVSIIIVTWNCRDYILRCLETISMNVGICFEVLIRDNGSTDRTIQSIQEQFPAVKLIGDSQNIGFAAANNEAIQHATGRYLLLLNPDTEIFPETLTGFIKTAETYSNQAMIVPTLLNSDGTLQPSRHSFPTISGVYGKILATFKRLLSQSDSNTELHVDWAIGACWFLPISMFETVGGLDTNLFMYGEDLDYCWQVHQAGFEIVWAPQIQVIHHSNISGQQKWGDQRLLKTYQGLIYFWLKYFSLTYTIAMILIRVSYILVRTLFDLATRITGLLLSQSSGEGREQLGQISTLIRACFDRDAWPLYNSALQHKK